MSKERAVVQGVLRIDGVVPNAVTPYRRLIGKGNSVVTERNVMMLTECR
jgi:hypothetical protein